VVRGQDVLLIYKGEKKGSVVGGIG